MLVAAPALADARRVAVARVRRADRCSTRCCSRCCRSTATGPDAARRVPARGLRQPVAVAVVAPLAGLVLCAAGGPTCRGSSRATTRARRCWRRSRSRWSWPGSRTARRWAASARPSGRRSPGVHAYVVTQAPDYRARARRRRTRSASSRTSIAPACRAAARWLCLYVNTDQSPAGVTRDGDTTPERRLPGAERRALTTGRMSSGRRAPSGKTCGMRTAGFAPTLGAGGSLVAASFVVALLASALLAFHDWPSGAPHAGDGTATLPAAASAAGAPLRRPGGARDGGRDGRRPRGGSRPCRTAGPPLRELGAAPGRPDPPRPAAARRRPLRPRRPRRRPLTRRRAARRRRAPSTRRRCLSRRPP